MTKTQLYSKSLRSRQFVCSGTYPTLIVVVAAFNSFCRVTVSPTSVLSCSICLFFMDRLQVVSVETRCSLFFVLAGTWHLCVAAATKEHEKYFKNFWRRWSWLNIIFWILANIMFKLTDRMFFFKNNFALNFAEYYVGCFCKIVFQLKNSGKSAI